MTRTGGVRNPQTRDDSGPVARGGRGGSRMETKGRALVRGRREPLGYICGDNKALPNVKEGQPYDRAESKTNVQGHCGELWVHDTAANNAITMGHGTQKILKRQIYQSRCRPPPEIKRGRNFKGTVQHLGMRVLCFTSRIYLNTTPKLPRRREAGVCFQIRFRLLETKFAKEREVTQRDVVLCVVVFPWPLVALLASGGPSTILAKAVPAVHLENEKRPHLRGSRMLWFSGLWPFNVPNLRPEEPIFSGKNRIVSTPLRGQCHATSPWYV